MPFFIPLPVLSVGLASALLAGVALAPADPRPAPPSAGTRSTAEGLLVFEVERPGADVRYWSVGGGRTPFSGMEHDDLEDALDWAEELDLSTFGDDGRIRMKNTNTCLSVTPATPVRPARATGTGCSTTDEKQHWKIENASDDRLVNVGTGLYIADTMPFSGWTMTESLAESPYRLLTGLLDGRPVPQPVFETEYDHATDTVTIVGERGPRDTAVSVFDDDADSYHLATTDGDGAFEAELPRSFGDLESVIVRIGRSTPTRLYIRTPEIDRARLAHQPDGTVMLFGEGGPEFRVDIGTGPLAADVVASGAADRNGDIGIPVPGARPGDTFVVYQNTTGVRTSLTVPERTSAIIGVEGPETELVRGRSTPVPIGVRAAERITRITSSFTLTAPEGTVFTPGTSAIEGQRKPAAGSWGARDPRFEIGDVRISDDGRTLTATYRLDASAGVTLAVDDELRWWPTLDVVDDDLAPASI